MGQPKNTVAYSCTYAWTHTGGQILIPRHFRKKKDDSFHDISVWKRQLDKKNEMLNIFQNSYVSLKLPNCTTVWSC